MGIRNIFSAKSRYKEISLKTALSKKPSFLDRMENSKVLFWLITGLMFSAISWGGATYQSCLSELSKDEEKFYRMALELKRRSLTPAVQLTSSLPVLDEYKDVAEMVRDFEGGGRHLFLENKGRSFDEIEVDMHRIVSKWLIMGHPVFKWLRDARFMFVSLKYYAKNGQQQSLYLAIEDAKKLINPEADGVGFDRRFSIQEDLGGRCVDIQAFAIRLFSPELRWWIY